MKKNANILDYLEQYKYKYGISYLADNKKLVKGLTVTAVLVWIYTFFWSLMIVLGTLIDLKGGKVFDGDGKNSFITIISCMGLMVVSAVLLCFKDKIFSSAILILSQPVMIMAFAHSTENVTGLGYIAAFYWRHLIPSIILILLSIFILVIFVGAKIKANKLYNFIVEGLYRQYGTKDGEKLTDEQWQEFLSNYNPKKANLTIEDENKSLV